MLNGLRLIVSNTVIGEETLYRQGPSVEVYKLQVHKVINQLACLLASLVRKMKSSGNLPFTVKMADFRELVQFIINYNNLKESRSKGK